MLGVAQDADDDAIKKAYRKLARKYHPDANPDDPKAEERFKEISHANDVLSDPEKRREYDAEQQMLRMGGGFGGGGRGGGRVSRRAASLLTTPWLPTRQHDDEAHIDPLSRHSACLEGSTHVC